MQDIYEQYEDFKKLEILFKDEEEEIHKVVGKVHDIEPSSITVYASKKKNPFEIPEDSTVKIYVYTENGIYTSDSNVIYTEDEEDKFIYTLTYPINNKHSQRREFFRADMCVPITVKVIKDLFEGKSITIETRTKDICGNGLSFLSDEEITDFEDIEVSIDLTDKIIDTTAKLIYSKPQKIRNKEVYVNALKFTSIKPKDIDFIVKKCFLFQLRLKNME